MRTVSVVSYSVKSTLANAMKKEAAIQKRALSHVAADALTAYLDLPASQRRRSSK